MGALRAPGSRERKDQSIYVETRKTKSLAPPHPPEAAPEAVSDTENGRLDAAAIFASQNHALSCMF